MPMKAFVETSRPLASLFLVDVDDEDVPDGVVPAAPGLFWSPAHVNLPLMTLLDPDSALKVLQSEVISAELWRLKAPRQSWREGKVTLERVSTWTREGEAVQYLLREVAIEVKGTANRLETGEAVGHVIELGVVLDLQTTVDGVEGRHRDVGQLRVANKGKSATNQSEVGSAQALEAVLIETQRTRNIGQGRDRDRWAVTERQVLGRLEVGERGLKTVAIARDGQGLRDVGHLHAHGLQQRVVDDGDHGDLLQVDAVERGQEGVLDIDRAGLCDAAGEAELLEVWQRLEVEVSHRRELRPVEGRQDLAVVEGEGATDLLDAVRAEGGDVGRIHDHNVASNCPHTSKVDVVRRARGYGDAAGEGRARGEGGRVALVLDGGGARDAALSCTKRRRVSILMPQGRATSTVMGMGFNGLPAAVPTTARAASSCFNAISMRH